MPVHQANRQRISDLTIRAMAISKESVITRQAWSDNFHCANDRNRALNLLTQMSELTAEAATVHWTIQQLRETIPLDNAHK
jgi:hypothetical protein